MYFKKSIIQAFLVCGAALLALIACDSTEAESLKYLTEGYWAEEEAPHAPLVNFTETGHLFYYVYTLSDETGGYDACYDPSAQKYTKYALDLPNGRICLLPDQWYDIKVNNPSSLTLGNDDATLKFIKINPADVRMLSVEEYFSKHPDQHPEN